MIALYIMGAALLLNAIYVPYKGPATRSWIVALVFLALAEIWRAVLT